MQIRQDYKPPFFQMHTVVGSLGGYVATKMDDMDEVIKQWSDGFMNIVWVNEPRHSGLDLTSCIVTRDILVSKLI